MAPYGTAVDPALVPANVQRAIAEQLQRSQSFDLTDFLNRQFSSVSINHAQNNPLQPDFNFRGFTASPLLGLPQGLAVYQNGVRINDPFGDTINWDLIPMSAIDSVQLLAGAQPVFGLNTLGGALSMQMKNGFSYQGTQAEVYDGSFGRRGGIGPGRRQRRTLGLLRRRRLFRRRWLARRFEVGGAAPVRCCEPARVRLDRRPERRLRKHGAARQWRFTGRTARDRSLRRVHASGPDGERAHAADPGRLTRHLRCIADQWQRVLSAPRYRHLQWRWHRVRGMRVRGRRIPGRGRVRGRQRRRRVLGGRTTTTSSRSSISMANPFPPSWTTAS